MILEGMKNECRVWQFAANRSLDELEESALLAALNNFVHQWQAHGKDLTAAADIMHASVVLVAIDEEAELPSGCSIDKVFRLLQQWGSANNVDFFNRLIITVPFCNASKIYSQVEAIQAIEIGDLHADHLVIDATLQQLGAVRNAWYIPFSHSWMGKKLSL